MTAAPSQKELLGLAAGIVSAHVSNNTVAAEALPTVITSVYDALRGVSAIAALPDIPRPAVPVSKSVFPAYLVCLEDGKKLAMLKRHLSTSYDMTPEQYRRRWGLPADYPMVAPNYSARRSALARENGLGLKDATPIPAPPPVRRIPEGVRGKKPARRPGLSSTAVSS